jgi:hypothetical protein
MAIDPDIVHRYFEARQQLDQAASTGLPPGDPVLLEAQERLREALAEYLLDLEVNGMSVPADLRDELDSLSEAPAPPPD